MPEYGPEMKRVGDRRKLWEEALSQEAIYRKCAKVILVIAKQDATQLTTEDNQDLINIAKSLRDEMDAAGMLKKKEKRNDNGS